MNKKALFFDNDGILVDTEKYYFEATKIILAEEGIFLTQEDYINYFLLQSKGAWFLLEEKGYNKLMIAELRNKRNQLYNSMLQSQKLLIEGVQESIKKLCGKFKLAIVTSSRKDHFETIHKSTELLKYFDFVLTREDYLESKPNPEPYLLALKKSGFTNADCLIIEDSPRGLQAALSAGIDCCVIPTELTKDCDFSGAKLKLNFLGEIFDYLG